MKKLLLPLVVCFALMGCEKEKVKPVEPPPPPDLGENFHVTCEIAEISRIYRYNYHVSSTFYLVHNGQIYHISLDANNLDANAYVTIDNEDLITDSSEYREGPINECYEFTHCAGTKFNIEFFNGNRSSITLLPNATYTVGESLANVELFKNNVDSLRSKGRRNLKATLHDIIDEDMLNAGNQRQNIAVYIKATDWMPEK